MHAALGSNSYGNTRQRQLTCVASFSVGSGSNLWDFRCFACTKNGARTKKGNSSRFSGTILLHWSLLRTSREKKIVPKVMYSALVNSRYVIVDVINLIHPSFLFSLKSFTNTLAYILSLTRQVFTI